MQQQPPPLQDGISKLKKVLVRLVAVLVLAKLGFMSYDYFNGEGAQLRDLEKNMAAWHWAGTGALTLNEECKQSKEASICEKAKERVGQFLSLCETEVAQAAAVADHGLSDDFKKKKEDVSLICKALQKRQ
jgi:hypothetical protein